MHASLQPGLLDMAGKFPQWLSTRIYITVLSVPHLDRLFAYWFQVAMWSSTQSTWELEVTLQELSEIDQMKLLLHTIAKALGVSPDNPH